MLRRLQDELGVDRLYPHLLMHSFARLYLKRGDLRNLQAVLGHASITTTVKIYLDPDIDDLKQKHLQASSLDHIVETHNQSSSLP
jgi:site-specific recombinase XerD